MNRSSRYLWLLGAFVMATLLGFVGVAWAQEDTIQQQNPSGDSAQLPKSSAIDDDGNGYDDATGYRGPSKDKQLRRPGAGGQGGAATTSPAPQSTTQTAPSQRAMGAYVYNVWTDPTTYITNFNTMVGSPMHVVHYFQNWAQSDKMYFDPTKMDDAVNSAPGAIPMVTWQSKDPTKGANQPTYADKNIVNGTFDSYIKQWADAAAAWGKSCQTEHNFGSPCKMFLRFDHEMNGNWFPWSPGVNGNTVSAWINAWKHVHNIFEKEGATNVLWVWSPYVNCGGCQSFSKVYPTGQDTTNPNDVRDYVDWVALDGYNWGTSQSWSTWQTATQIFKPSYDMLTTQIAPSKPYMIAETSSAEAGGSKAGWITDLYNSAIPNSMPLTRAVVWFSADKTAQGETDWRVDSSTQSLAAYQTVAAQTAWQGYVP